MIARAVSLVVVALAGAALAVPASSAAAGFTLGVAAGDVSASSAVLWAHAGRTGAVTVEVASDRRFRHVAARARTRAARSHDLTVRAVVRRLPAGRPYFYRWRQGSATSPVGRFRTAPGPKQSRTVRFAWSGDADAQKAPGATALPYNDFGAYARMAAQGNDFNVNLGDTIYSDSEVAGAGTLAATVAQKWAKYRQNLAVGNLQRLRDAAGLYSQWDDHEFVNDFTKAENGAAIYGAGVRAFGDYAPVTYTKRDGLYRSFRWGRNLEVFLPDERSFRSAKASANHACDNPQTHQPDLAPTGPPATRALFAVASPSLKQPVSAACLAAIDDPSRTMLGARQYARFTSALQHSTARWKVVLNEVPIQQFYALPYDRWEGYAAERTRLLQFIAAPAVKNVVFLTTDTHANFVGPVRLQTLEAGGPKDTGMTEVVTGPVATKTFSREIDDTLGSPGSGDLITRAFLKPAPPAGIGMTCANPNVYSFGEVTVTAKTLKIDLRDLTGAPIKDIDGGACGPFTLQAK
ncbi:MAG: Alkaline phosphatase [Solirubrobacterales bacterium]|nr:Alkaline phosphatase [Solirubrobacterales bacterium]